MRKIYKYGLSILVGGIILFGLSSSAFCGMEEPPPIIASNEK